MARLQDTILLALKLSGVKSKIPTESKIIFFYPCFFCVSLRPAVPMREPDGTKSKNEPIYFITLPTTAIIEKARIPTTTPAIPHIKADLAFWTFSGSPPAVKK